MTALRTIAGLSFVASLFAAGGAAAQNVELRYMCYGDANECEVSRSLLDRFEAKNPGIKVVLDKVGFSVIREAARNPLAGGPGSGHGARHRARRAEQVLSRPAAPRGRQILGRQFRPMSAGLRMGPDDKGVYGFLTQLTVVGPFVNKTMFDEAGVKIPAPGASWDDWAKRRARCRTSSSSIPAWRWTAPATASPAQRCPSAPSFDANGRPAVIDDGFKAFSERMVRWHKDGLMPKDIWPAASGAKWKNAGTCSSTRIWRCMSRAHG